ncbi:hypothetical protein JNJ66_07140 [Candidatus Saccharibacteria bacterium]|nr:hypothetical protein [Candidatus Saccharibacteria bacterium]
MAHRKINTARQLASRFFASDGGKAVMLAVGWQLMMTVMGIIFDSTLNNIFQRPASPEPHGMLGHTLRWDAGWYQAIVHGAYADPASASPVFYPLFPLMVWLLDGLSFGLLGEPLSALIINTAATACIILALARIAEHFVGRKHRWWLPAIFLTSPAAIFLHFFYTEAIFCAVGFWAYLFALQRRWWAMGLALAVLTAVRLPAILFVALCGLEFIRAYGWNIRQTLNRNLLWFLLAPLGFVLYGLYLQLVRGDFLLMLHAYKLTDDWPYQVFNPNIFELYRETARRVRDALLTPVPFDEGIFVNLLLPMIGLMVLFAAAVYSLWYKRKAGIPLAVFGILAMVMFSLNSNLISVNRYLLPCIVIYIAILHLSLRRGWLRPVTYGCIYVGILLQAYLYILFVNNYFAG